MNDTISKFEKLQNEVAEQLMATGPVEYGEKFTDHYLKQYEDFVKSTYTVSDWRKSANQYFMGFNSALVAGLAIANLDTDLMAIFSSMAGFILCIAWWGSLNFYKSLNSAKFKVIHEMEKHLPMSPFKAEYYAQVHADEGHTTATAWEKWVPKLFIGLHLAVMWANVYQVNLGK